MLYRVHLVWAGFELTTLVVISTDCTDSCKSNYHTITTRTEIVSEWFFTAISWEGHAIIDDMMMYVVNKTNMPSWLTKASPQIDMSLPCDTHCLDSDSNQSVLSSSYYMLSGEPVNTNFIVLALLWDRNHDLQHLRWEYQPQHYRVSYLDHIQWNLSELNPE